MDEDVFLNAFENVPKIQVYSAKDVDQHMSQINDCLADLNNDWEKRVDSLKRIRSLLIASASQYEDEFFLALKQISVSFQLQVKDLRSQIVREACITIAYLSQSIGQRLEIFIELTMPHLINLIQNSAKVMASSGQVAVRFIIEVLLLSLSRVNWQYKKKTYILRSKYKIKYHKGSLKIFIFKEKTPFLHFSIFY